MSLTCTSWLVYATRATDDSAKRVKNLIVQIKADRMDPATAMPVVQLVIDRAVKRLGDRARQAFHGRPVLVPVPGAGLTKPNTVWPARRICEELVAQGLGVDVQPLVTRTRAVEKSAGSAARPSLEAHLASFAVQKGIGQPTSLIVVDDVVTSGTTIMGCATRLALSHPGSKVSAFALARVLSMGNPERVLDPLVERITIEGDRCRRGGG